MARPLPPPTKDPTKGSSARAVRGFRSRPPTQKTPPKGGNRTAPTIPRAVERPSPQKTNILPMIQDIL